MPNHRLPQVRPVALALSGAALSFWSAGANAAGPACPASLAVAEAPGAVPTGFRAFLNGDPPTRTFNRPVAHRLDAIMFSDGPPDGMAWLAPSAGGARVQRWAFTPRPGAATWLSCGYLATSVIVSSPLPPTIRSCRVTYDPVASPPTARDLACR